MSPSGLAALAAAALCSSEARAGDGAYGRLDGDLELSGALGGAYVADAGALSARAAALYVQAAGVYLGYLDAFGQGSAVADRSIAAGVTLRPLFWGRFAKDLMVGEARTDLLIDSVALEVGAFWVAPHGRAMEDLPGLELAAGIALPVFANATGLFVELRGALRYRPVDLLDGSRFSLWDQGAYLSVSLAWHHVLRAHIVDAGDRAPW